MAKVILLCGKVCCGKTTYARQLQTEGTYVLLSCDELTLTLFPEGLGVHHDRIASRVQQYLYAKSIEILQSGTNVILDWGFWSRRMRQEARDFYETHGIPYEFHYVSVPDAVWQAYIAKRNREGSAYFVDEGLIQKCLDLFEEPDAEELQ